MHIIIMLLLISLLIIVHELGHFWVARLFNTKVDRFGFGLPFGPTLWEKKIGDVTYCIHAFLLGGYVAFPDDDPDSEIPEDDPGRLNNKPIWQRTMIIAAGVTANALLAFVIVIGVVIFGNGIPTDYNDIYVRKLSDDIPYAREAGLKAGDKIVSINNIKVKSFGEFKLLLISNKADDGFVSDKDATKQINNIISCNPKVFEKLGYNLNKINKKDLIKIKDTVIPENFIITIPEAKKETLIVPDLKDPFAALQPQPKEGKLTEYERHLKTSIKKEKFVGNNETTFGEIAKASSDGMHLLDLTVDRKGKELTLVVTPNKDGNIGFIPTVKDVYVPAKSFGQVLVGSWDYMYSKTALMCMGLYKIFTGQISLWDLHGIVAITKVGGDIIKSNGMIDAWLLTALISIDLAIVNLLPIPALDGGHIMFLILEKIRGRPVEEKYLEAATKFGFMFLIGLMLFIIFNDILGIVTGKF
ncbi:MAG: site-2 protease family protein [Cyanobacteriota bacterium]